MFEITINEIGDGERIQVYSQRAKYLNVPLVIRAVLESAQIEEEKAEVDAIGQESD